MNAADILHLYNDNNLQTIFVIEQFTDSHCRSAIHRVIHIHLIYTRDVLISDFQKPHL